SHATARAWIDLLQTSYIVHLLPPWFTNTSKRLVKSPKLYFYDVGLASWLLGLRSADQLQRDPLYGALFENFVIMEAIKDRLNQGQPSEMYFYRDAEGNEVDLLLPMGRKFHAIEIKAGQTVAPDYFKGLKKFSEQFPQLSAGGGVIFGGDQGQTRTDWPVYSWRILGT
ncbi:MAG: ATP-binding protein, partial [Burkholderiaceae bacterium]